MDISKSVREHLRCAAQEMADKGYRLDEMVPEFMIELEKMWKEELDLDQIVRKKYSELIREDIYDYVVDNWYRYPAAEELSKYSFMVYLEEYGCLDKLMSLLMKTIDQELGSLHEEYKRDAEIGEYYKTPEDNFIPVRHIKIKR